MFRKDLLTYVHHWGCNLLGVIDLTMLLIPVLIVPSAHGRWPKVVMLVCSVCVLVGDLQWRWRNEPDPRWWVKAGSYDAGGSLVYIPAWLIALGFVVLAVFVLMLPEAPSPYAR